MFLIFTIVVFFYSKYQPSNAFSVAKVEGKQGYFLLSTIPEQHLIWILHCITCLYHLAFVLRNVYWLLYDSGRNLPVQKVLIQLSKVRLFFRIEKSYLQQHIFSRNILRWWLKISHGCQNKIPLCLNCNVCILLLESSVQQTARSSHLTGHLLLGTPSTVM